MREQTAIQRPHLEQRLPHVRRLAGLRGGNHRAASGLVAGGRERDPGR